MRGQRAGVVVKDISVVWFRQDLRVSDNPALAEAASCGSILPIYIFDNCAPGVFQMGGASKVWLHHALQKLDASLQGKLNLYVGHASKMIGQLIEQHAVQNVFCNKCYEPWHVAQEQAVQQVCTQKNVLYKAFNSNYLWAPDGPLKDDGSFYKVFTAYKKRAYQSAPRATMRQPKNMALLQDAKNKTSLAQLKLLPSHKAWAKTMISTWQVGESAAQEKLHSFIKKGLAGYRLGRDVPSAHHTSRLSPHLHFGEVSPAQVWEAVNSFGAAQAVDADREHFLSEIMWREFSCYLLHHFKGLHQDNFNPRFDRFPWQPNAKWLKAWQLGQTGYPLVDAGMRQLWQTGYMHNRVRMVVASFLVKNLNIHWRHGRDCFWDCLLDADLANNSASWQWVAGCGADAAPYFRIFNPTSQGEKFDPQGHYVKVFVPQLQKLPDRYLFRPWQAPTDVLKDAGVVLGDTYPKPIIDLAPSRDQALQAYKNL